MSEEARFTLLSGEDNNTIRRSKYFFPIVNTSAYLLNALITYGIGAGGFGLDIKTNSDLSAKYQTLVTPAPAAFAIWGIIFLFQLVWTLQQFFRTSSLQNVLEMEYKYLWVVLTQSLWTLLFSLEWITASSFAMLAILATLFRIVFMNDRINKESRNIGSEGENQTTSQRTVRYLSEEFPFALHCGWICVASAVNLNLALISWNIKSSDFEYIFGLISLYVVLFAASVCVFVFGFVTVPAVHSYGLYFIHLLLANAAPASIVARYTQNQIDVIERHSFSISVAILLLIAIKFGLSFVKFENRT